MIATIGIAGVVVIALAVIAYLSDGLSFLREKNEREDFRSKWERPSDKTED